MALFGAIMSLILEFYPIFRASFLVLLKGKAMNRIGFDNEKYIRLQSAHISERIAQFGGKLYLEFGGKLFDDNHAARVLPGFQPDSKLTMLKELRDRAEIVIIINAEDIEKNKMRGDLGITYDLDVLRLIEVFKSFDLYVGSVVITRYDRQTGAENFEKRLKSLGIKVYRHYTIPGYPSNIPYIVSDEGYGKNEYIETTRPLVVVTAPGPGSGKMAVCMSQLYHDYKRGIKSGYAKFETFPVWNLPLKHPVNLAYEAATADLNDVNMIDPYYLEAYGKTTVNYNRDVESFPVVRTMFQMIQGESPYKSPTDMGVNMVGFCITDDEVVRKASEQEIIRRYMNTRCLEWQGMANHSEVYKLELLMNQMGITKEDRPVIKAALDRADLTEEPAAALQLNDGQIITGRTSALLGASSAVLLNSLKVLAGIPHETHLISPSILEPIQKLKIDHMGNRNPRLHMDETLIALSISAVTDPVAALALTQLPKLKDTEAHSTVKLSKVDENVYKRLGINLTCEATYQSKRIFQL